MKQKKPYIYPLLTILVGVLIAFTVTPWVIGLVIAVVGFVILVIRIASSVNHGYGVGKQPRYPRRIRD